MFLRICEKNHPSVIYATNEFLDQCLLCHYLQMLDDSEAEIKELKAEIRELKIESGANILEEIREKARKEKDACINTEKLEHLPVTATIDRRTLDRCQEEKNSLEARLSSLMGKKEKVNGI